MLAGEHDLFEMLHDSFVKNKSIGIYDGAYKDVAPTAGREWSGRCPDRCRVSFERCNPVDTDTDSCKHMPDGVPLNQRVGKAQRCTGPAQQHDDGSKPEDAERNEHGFPPVIEARGPGRDQLPSCDSRHRHHCQRRVQRVADPRMQQLSCEENYRRNRPSDQDLAFTPPGSASQLQCNDQGQKSGNRPIVQPIRHRPTGTVKAEAADPHQNHDGGKRPEEYRRGS